MEELTKDRIYGRFLEAADVLRRLPPVRYPKEFGNGMPEVVRDYADAMMREEGRDKSEWSFTVRPEPPTASAITRMEETTDWSIRFLMAWPKHRGCSPRQALWTSAICSVGRRSFAGQCRYRGWNVRTAYRRIDLALQTVRDGLTNNYIEFRDADVEFVSRLTHNPAHSTL